MDTEEKELSETYDAGAMKLENPSRGLIEMPARAGENTFKKDKRLNIRLSLGDRVGIQRNAVQKGIPYQALISGLIHPYVEGDIQE